MNKTHDFKLNMPDYSDVVDIDILNDNFRVIDDALMAGLCEKEYTGNNMGSSDPASRKYAWAPWFEIKNENDFDVQVTDRNFETTITIEAGTTYRKYIVGTYYMNFYVQDQHDVTFRWFTDAETRINEIDPSGGGSVSSVNVTGASSSHIVTSGGPITSSGTIEIDLAEGYSIPQTNKQTAWDGKAADLKAEIDSSTYVLTLQLKDSSGNLIGNERTIDLPLETMVVDGEYDPQTQKIKLELKNGNYVEFSVADLVSGLQTELSSSNKLDPTYIAYDATHRAVSDTEKDTWNGKQNAISDLATIRSGAAAGATAVQPSTMEDALDDKQDSIDGSHKLSSDLVDDTNKTNKFVTSTEKNTWNSKQNALTFDDAPTSGSNNPVKSGGIYTALSGKQDTIDSSHKLSSALVSFSTAQNAALSSGIDSTKVSQISTNQSNILYTMDHGAKNLFNMYKWMDECSVVGGNKSVDSTYTLTLGATSSNCYTEYEGNTYPSDVEIYVQPNEQYVMTWGYIRTVGSGRGTVYIVFVGSTGETSVSVSAEIKKIEFTTPAGTYGLRVYIKQTTSGLYEQYAYMMICSKVVWDTLGHDYQPPSVPNYDLTRLQAEDRAGLIECVDGGAKNVLSIEGETRTVNGVTATYNSDGSITTSGTASGGNANFTIHTYTPAEAAKLSGLVLSGCPSGGSDATWNLILQKNSSNYDVYARDTGNGAVVGTVPSTSCVLILQIKSGYSKNATWYPMLCTKAAFGVSQKFVPYRPNYDLVVYTDTKSEKSVTFTAADVYQQVRTVTVPSSTHMRISVIQYYSGAVPSGIIISSASTADTIAKNNTYGKAEQPSTYADYETLNLNLITYVHNNSSTTALTLYIYCKAGSASQTNRVSYALEII